MRRTAATLAALATVAASLAFGQAAAEAAGVITPSATTVARGSAFTATVNGCTVREIEEEDGFTIQEPVVVLVVGSGPDERLASYGEVDEEGPRTFVVPGWVDPAQPAALAGRCTRTTYAYDEEPGGSTTVTTVFTFPDVPIDITPGPSGVTTPEVALSRTVAASGQVITITGSGCAGGRGAMAVLAEGPDRSGRTLDRFLAFDEASVAAGGGFVLDLALVSGRFDDGYADPGLPDGDYTLLTICARTDGRSVMAEPQRVTVSGSNPVGEFEADIVGDSIEMQGGGCTGGREVTVTIEGDTWEDGGLVTDTAPRARARARTRPDPSRLGARSPEPKAPVLDTVTATPDADGAWSAASPAPEGSFDVVVRADCGDPRADGFRYVERVLYGDSFADLWVERVSPTSSPAGGAVRMQVQGMCDGEVTVALVDADGDVAARSGPVALDAYETGSGTVTAPDSPGIYRAVGMCDDESGYGERYEVFAPATVSAEAPLPGEPTTGWPSTGAREVYHGRIGPISLPPEGMEDMAADKAGPAGRKLGPGGLFIPVPRPAGDFAITAMRFDLVDAEGMPVSQDDVHLHHFVIANRSEANPACPDGSTFGLPGEIVGAAGAERTVLELGDPYGEVVRDTDDWTGVYELMSRSDQPQEVYLSYDIDLRRDVENVRPVTRYFGSATGCSTFTWTIDGSGTPDVQSHFITVGAGGRLIGGGAHIHNGGMHADIVNDRGRRLCRSELVLGDTAMGGHQRGAPQGRVTETTMVGEPIPGGGDYPPEFYDDDPMIEGITNCALAEAVSAGERIRFDAVYENERARSGAMGIFTLYVWEGGGPATPEATGTQPPPPANAVDGTPIYTG